jgi:hypothetical protein
MVALLVGFGVLLLAGMSGAYLVGARSARSISITLPAAPRPQASTLDEPSAVESKPDIAPALTLGAETPSLPIAATIPIAGRKLKIAPHPFADSRAFERLDFPGTALATIYPHEWCMESQPLQCVVDTRDLSRSGIGIAHTEQLYPNQMVVLDAVGKLLVGEVRWCHRVDSSFYVAGCRLVKTGQ